MKLNASLVVFTLTISSFLYLLPPWTYFGATVSTAVLLPIYLVKKYNLALKKYLSLPDLLSFVLLFFLIFALAKSIPVQDHYLSLREIILLFNCAIVFTLTLYCKFSERSIQSLVFILCMISLF